MDFTGSERSVSRSKSEDKDRQRDKDRVTGEAVEQSADQSSSNPQPSIPEETIGNPDSEMEPGETN